MKAKIIQLPIVLCVVLFVGYSFVPLHKITIKGSDTMVLLSKEWATVYIQKHPGTSIQVSGGGSGFGISELINGSAEIANSSRPIDFSELEKIKEKYNKKGVEIPCAKDGLSVFLNKGNAVSELSIQQLSDIFSGKTTNWKQVGGEDAKIKLYGRESNSGSFEFFKEHVVKKDFSSNCKVLRGTASVVNAVKNDKYGIGYGGAAYVDGVKDCKVKKDENSKGVLPTATTIKNKTYPISRYLYMYLKSKPTGETKAFVDWILSPEGQALIEGVGYFSLK